MSATLTLSVEQARRILLRSAGLAPVAPREGVEGVKGALEALGCIQLDPIDRIGTNADLVAHARVEGLKRGDWARVMPRHAFEHFAKERCLLPARAFPYYRERLVEPSWWRLTEQQRKLPQEVLDAVLAELRERGPLSASALSDYGAVAPMDWGGWKGTSKAGSLALEVLWTRCMVVSAGRTPGGHRVYDLPERALPEVAARPGGDFERWALAERARSCGLLSMNSGPWWSMLYKVRTSALPEQMVREGALARVRVAGARREYLCDPAQLERLEAPLEVDERMRVLGPLDPLIWDRLLVKQVFDFDYIWEIYKPAPQRRYGYYVCPLLHRGRFVGRIEGRREGSPPRVAVERIWGEPEPGALAEAVDRLSSLQG